MADEAKIGSGAGRAGPSARRIARAGLLAGAIALAGAAMLGWGTRERIADRLIAQMLADQGLVASYEVCAMTPRRQALCQVVVGDPAAPDLVIERIEITLRPRLGLPRIARIALVRPRLRASYRAGVLSLGSLDQVVFADRDKPFSWPDLDLVIEDGRALLESEHGPIAARFAGAGHLRGGFAGDLAVRAPLIDLGSDPGACTLRAAALTGRITISGGIPAVRGPVQISGLDCAQAGVWLARARLGIDLRAERDLAGLRAVLRGEAGAARMAGGSLGAVAIGATFGEGRLVWRENGLGLDYALRARQITTSALHLGSLDLGGHVRHAPDPARPGLARLEAEGTIVGSGVRLGSGGQAVLARAMEATGGTLLAPLLGRIRQNLSQELARGQILARFVLREAGGERALLVPEASLVGTSGQSVLGLSRVELALADGRLPRFEGNFATGGAGLPRLAGRMEQRRGQRPELRLAMPAYSAGGARLAIGGLRLVQQDDGTVEVAGEIRAQGPLGAGHVRGLVVPVDARLAPGGGAFALWQGCRTLRHEGIELAGLMLEAGQMNMCPPAGRAILRHGPAGIDLALGMDQMATGGSYQATPLALRSGPLALSWRAQGGGDGSDRLAAGAFSASDIELVLGEGRAGSGQTPADPEPSRLRIAELALGLGNGRAQGRFAGAGAVLAAPAIEIAEASGAIRLAAGQMQIDGASFLVADQQARIRPLQVSGARAALVDGRLTAEAGLRRPLAMGDLARITIAHDLALARGRADFLIPDLAFGPDLQPLDLTPLALGAVANVAGTVTGEGAIEWHGEQLASRATFATSGLDFAAAFGPVRGIRARIEFTDLLGLTTAPDQKVFIGAINPGIEINDGQISFALEQGRRLRLGEGAWPFLGGTLRLRPVEMNFGTPETRRFEVVIEGLQAYRFVEQMELHNLAASGTFDGVIPIIFDESGNGRLEGGVLVARRGGGHLSYVGQLSYEDMGMMANMAIGALRDVKFANAVIGMNGPLAGELVTHVRFDGLGQGQMAARNLITRKIARLPIRLMLNIKAPFAQLISSTRALYDPAALRDPRGLGLLGDDGRRLRPMVDQQTVDRLDQEAAAAQIERQRRALVPPPPGPENIPAPPAGENGEADARPGPLWPAPPEAARPESAPAINAIQPPESETTR